MTEIIKLLAQQPINIHNRNITLRDNTIQGSGYTEELKGSGYTGQNTQINHHPKIKLSALSVSGTVHFLSCLKNYSLS